MWNDIIKSFNVSYLPTALTLFAKVTMLRTDFNNSDLATCIGLGVFLVTQIIVSIVVLCRNKNRLEDPEFTDKFGSYMRGIKPKGYLYEPVMMLLKLSFVCIPLFMPDQGNKIQILLFMQTIFIIWHGKTEPHKNQFENRLMIVNQAIQMLIFYHLVMFSDFVIEPETKFTMGYSLLICLGILIALNIGISIKKQISSALR